MPHGDPRPAVLLRSARRTNPYLYRYRAGRANLTPSLGITAGTSRGKNSSKRRIAGGEGTNSHAPVRRHRRRLRPALCSYCRTSSRKSTTSHAHNVRHNHLVIILLTQTAGLPVGRGLIQCAVWGCNADLFLQRLQNIRFVIHQENFSTIKKRLTHTTISLPYFMLVFHNLWSFKTAIPCIHIM